MGGLLFVVVSDRWDVVDRGKLEVLEVWWERSDSFDRAATGFVEPEDGTGFLTIAGSGMLAVSCSAMTLTGAGFSNS